MTPMSTVSACSGYGVMVLMPTFSDSVDQADMRGTGKTFLSRLRTRRSRYFCGSDVLHQVLLNLIIGQSIIAVAIMSDTSALLLTKYAGGVYRKPRCCHARVTHEKKFGFAKFNEDQDEAYRVAQKWRQDESDRLGLTKRIYASGQPDAIRKYLAG
jgi:hypothetical protein